MADVTASLDENRAALAELIQASERSASVWTTPRAPGKWSPSQVVEHVARSLDESANDFAGRPSKFPRLPFFVRPVVRGLLFNRVLKTGRFPKAKTNKAMDPEKGPETPGEGRTRLENAWQAFERECRAAAQRGEHMATATFGRVSVADYVRFNTIHTRHHRGQIPEA